MDKIEIKDRHRILDDFFAVERINLRYPEGEEVQRFIVLPKRAAAILLYKRHEDKVILVSQYRIAARLNGENNDLLEIPAGVLDEDEDAEECIKRESLEETGYKVEKAEFISRLFMSPGYTAEAIELYYAEVSAKDKKAEGGGLEDEMENIRLIEMPLKEALRKVERGEMKDAKTALALLWLARKEQV